MALGNDPDAPSMDILMEATSVVEKQVHQDFFRRKYNHQQHRHGLHFSFHHLIYFSFTFVMITTTPLLSVFIIHIMVTLMTRLMWFLSLCVVFDCVADTRIP